MQYQYGSSQQNKYGSSQRCKNCGLSHESGNCMARDKVCYKCHHRGHLSRCGFQKVESVEVEQQAGHSIPDSVVEDITLYSVEVKSVGLSYTRDWVVIITIDDVQVEVKLDTGAQGNVLSSLDFNRLKNRPPLCARLERLVGYNGGVIPTQGKGTFLTKCNGSLKSTEFYVVPGGGRSILGMADGVSFSLIARIVEISQVSQGFSPMSYSVDDAEYRGLFQGLGCLPGRYQIRLKPEVTPVVHPCRKVPFQVLDKVKTEIERMKDLGVITEVREPTEWVSSMVIVPKKNGDLRVCLDPRNLNRAIRRQHL